MKNIHFRKVCFMMFCGLLHFQSMAQQVLIVPLQQQTELFFFDQLFQVNVINANPQSLEGFLEIDVEDRRGKAMIKMTSPIFVLEAGAVKQSNEIAWGNTIEMGRSQFISSIAQTGRLPYGEYTFCYRFIAAPNVVTGTNGGQVLGVRCQETTAKTFGMPALISPYNKAVLTNKYPLLTWKPPLPLISQNVTYNIRLTYLKRRQSPTKALRVNFPLLEEKNINTTFLQYPISAYPLELDKSYVWQVSAFYNGIPLGETEIWTFRLQETEKEEKITRVDESYRFVKPSMGAGYYLATNTIYFAYENRMHDSKLNYTIFKEGSTEDESTYELTDLPNIPLVDGINTIALEGGEIQGLKGGGIYIMRITDPIGDQYYLKFKYTVSEE